MDDCIENLDEPLYGFRVKITQEKQCSELGPDCGMNSTTINTNLYPNRYLLKRQLQVRQTGETFRSDAPPDCRVEACG